MKTLNKLNLAYLNRRELDDREMNALRGGGNDSSYCVCHNCTAVDSGDNRNANSVYGYTISGGYGAGDPGGAIIDCDCPNPIDDMASVRSQA